MVTTTMVTTTMVTTTMVTTAIAKVSFTGVGVGPGDPELLTLKAYRLITQADVVCYLENQSHQSQARTIAAEALSNSKFSQREMPIQMPMLSDRSQLNPIYDRAANDIAEALEAGHNVVFLCEGDPLFFGSFAYLLERLEGKYSCDVVPGISSIQAGSARLQIPLTMLKEKFAVFSGHHAQSDLETALEHYDSLVIMKAGKARLRILAALRNTGRLHEARYLEYIGRENEKVILDCQHLDEAPGPYFSLFIVTRTERFSK